MLIPYRELIARIDPDTFAEKNVSRFLQTKEVQSTEDEAQSSAPEIAKEAKKEMRDKIIAGTFAGMIKELQEEAQGYLQQAMTDRILFVSEIPSSILEGEEPTHDLLCVTSSAVSHIDAYLKHVSKADEYREMCTVEKSLCDTGFYATMPPMRPVELLTCRVLVPDAADEEYYALVEEMCIRAATLLGWSLRKSDEFIDGIFSQMAQSAEGMPSDRRYVFETDLEGGSVFRERGAGDVDSQGDLVKLESGTDVLIKQKPRLFALGKAYPAGVSEFYDACTESLMVKRFNAANVEYAELRDDFVRAQEELAAEAVGELSS